MSSTPVIVLLLIVLGTCHGCSIVGHNERAHSIAKGLGFKDCAASGPFTRTQVMERDKKSGAYLWKSQPSWDGFVSQYVPGDLIYYIDCRAVDRIVVGMDFYALVRAGVAIDRELEVIYE